MAKSKEKKVKTPSPKKEIRQQVTDKLRNTLTELEEKLGKKELESRIKKAAKMLTAGIKIKTPKPKKNKPAKDEATASAEKGE